MSVVTAVTASYLIWLAFFLLGDVPSPTDDEEEDEQQRSEYLEDMGCLEKYFSDLKEMSVPMQPPLTHGVCMICYVGSDVVLQLLQIIP